MSRKLFGTDGVRGRANSHPMTAEMALKLGAAAGLYFRWDNTWRNSGRVDWKSGGRKSSEESMVGSPWPGRQQEEKTARTESGTISSFQAP